MEFFVWVMFFTLIGAVLLIPFALSFWLFALLAKGVKDILGIFYKE